jgi:hypothetical protein
VRTIPELVHVSNDGIPVLFQSPHRDYVARYPIDSPGWHIRVLLRQRVGRIVHEIALPIAHRHASPSISIPLRMEQSRVISRRQNRALVLPRPEEPRNARTKEGWNTHYPEDHSENKDKGEPSQK